MKLFCYFYILLLDLLVFIHQLTPSSLMCKILKGSFQIFMFEFSSDFTDFYSIIVKFYFFLYYFLNIEWQMTVFERACNKIYLLILF